MDSRVPWVHQLLEPAPLGLSIGSLVEEYLADCRRRGLSPKTVDYAYGYPLRHDFLPWCSRVGIGDPQRLASWLLDRFAGELLIQGGKEGPAGQAVGHHVRSHAQPVPRLGSSSRRHRARQGKAAPRAAKARRCAVAAGNAADRRCRLS